MLPLVKNVMLCKSGGDKRRRRISMVYEFMNHSFPSRTKANPFLVSITNRSSTLFSFFHLSTVASRVDLGLFKFH